MYSVYDYGSMIANKPRLNAYAQALRKTVKPSSVMLDIGAGTGIWSLLACQLGARSVYAIEPEDVIQVAREIALANGYTQRIQFIQNLSTQVTLPERADMIVSDLRGVLPFFQHHLPSIVDARKRLLAPNGILIPRRDTLWIAIVEEPDLYSRYTAPWDNKEFGLDMEGARRIAINMWSKARIKPEQLLVKPQCWAALDYALLESYDASSKVNWVIEQGGTAHGLGVWFDSDLVESVNLSNAPGAPELIYGNAFFPLLNPVDLAKCDTVNVEITANLVGEDYIWRWNFTVLSEGNPQKIKADFKQSSFLATPLSPSTLRKIADNHVPVLNENAQIDQFIISMMDGNASLGDIAHQVMKKFPNRFSKWYDVLTHVGKLSEKYSE